MLRSKASSEPKGQTQTASTRVAMSNPEVPSHVPLRLDPSSATRPAGRNDCNQEAMAGSLRMLGGVVIRNLCKPIVPSAIAGIHFEKLTLHDAATEAS